MRQTLGVRLSLDGETQNVPHRPVQRRDFMCVQLIRLSRRMDGGLE